MFDQQECYATASNWYNSEIITTWRRWHCVSAITIWRRVLWTRLLLIVWRRVKGRNIRLRTMGNVMPCGGKIWNSRNIDILKEEEVFRVSNFYIILNNFIMNNIVLLKNMWFVSKERLTTTTWSHIQGNLKYKPSLPCVHNWEKGQKDTTPMLFRTVTLQINQSYLFP